MRELSRIRALNPVVVCEISLVQKANSSISNLQESSLASHSQQGVRKDNWDDEVMYQCIWNRHLKGNPTCCSWLHEGF